MTLIRSNLSTVCSMIGIYMVTYKLMQRGWDVAHNLGGQGYDLLIKKGSVSWKVEVKATDPLLKTGPMAGDLTASLSPEELATADFCIFYIHDHDVLFIIPKSNFPPPTSGTIKV